MEGDKRAGLNPVVPSDYPVAPGCEVVSKLTATDHFLMVALRFLAAG